MSEIVGTKEPAGSKRPPLAPGLYIVATPIGNLRDITLRALDTLAGASAVICEDTRVTGRLMTHFGLKTPLAAYHEHNAALMRPKLLAQLAEGRALALVSDAGTPLISDPGFKLVRAAAEAGHAVFTVPGASSVTAALSIGGLPTDRFLFLGFLPPKTAGRRAALAEVKGIAATLVFLEAPSRLAASLSDLAAILGPRPAAIAREMTKIHEEVRRGTLAALAEAYAVEDAPKGEIVILVGPPEESAIAPSDDVIDAALARALAEGQSLKLAVAAVAGAQGLPRRVVYARALALKAPARQ
jgi:16S rRNA (cytidine1402-2'-O)-methyltransferase